MFRAQGQDMKYFSLPNANAQVSSIGLGGMALCPVPLEEAVRVVRGCLEAGVTFFETAVGYKTSEWKLGIGLAGCRRTVVLASKSRERGKQGMLQHVQSSLMRLQTDYIDIYQCHYVNRMETLDEILCKDGAVAGLIEARDRGWIRHIGISGHSAEVMTCAVERFPFDTVQMPYNLVNEFNLVALQPAQEAGALTIGNKPFMAGELLKYSLTAARLARILEARLCPDVIIPGLSSVEQVKLLFDAQDEPVAEPTHAELFPMSDLCPFCRECRPCPHGVPLSNLVRAYEILTHYDNSSTNQAVFLDLCKHGVAIPGCQTGCECAAHCSCKLPLAERIQSVLQRIPSSVF
jgi:predicted aldo/keto reductase-like oxidoreductase